MEPKMEDFRITKGVARYSKNLSWYARLYVWLAKLKRKLPFMPTPISERLCRTCRSFERINVGQPRYCANVWRLYNSVRFERGEKGKCGPDGKHYRRDRHAKA